MKQANNWQALRLLARATQSERRPLLISIIGLTLAAGLEVLGPIIGKILIDEHILPRELDWMRMSMLLIALLLCGWSATALRYFQLVRLSGLAMRSVQRLREWVYDHTLRLPMIFFDKAITGQLVSRVTNDTESVKALYIQVLFVILDNGIVLLGAMVAMAWLDWRLMLIVSTLFPTVIVIVWFYQRWSAPAVARARALRGEINALVAESIGGMSVLQACNATQRFGTNLDKINQAHYTARQAEVRANAWLLRPALDMLNILLLVAVLFSFGQRPISGLEVGILYAFINYMARVVEPLIQITMQFSQLQQSLVAAARVNALLQEPAIGSNDNGERITRGAVSIRQVSFGYSPDKLVLSNVDMDVPAGAFYGIAGHTGSGKSTLLSLMLRFYRVQSGHIEIDGVALDRIGADAYRADISLVPQEPFLLATSVRENIDMGRGLSEAEIVAAARSAQVHDFVSNLEQGYDTRLGEGGARLSTGQKQLVAIARALAGKPRILFLDEATSHIDSETEQIVQKTLDALRGQVTIIAIAHRLSTIRHADRIVVLNHGQVAESGTHEMLMNIEGGIYQRLYLLQQLEL